MRAFSSDRGIRWIEQAEQKGTGHAVLCCREALRGFDNALVLCGDGPLIREQTLQQLLETHAREQAAATLATAVLEDPTGYGRIVRDADGQLTGIVEQRDCTPEQLAIREVNPSYYCYRTGDLFAALDQVRPNNAKNEYYLTDTLGILIAARRKVVAITAVPPADILSINSRQELALVNRVMRDRILDRHMSAGVTIVDPATTWIDSRVTIGQDTVIQPFTFIAGPGRIGRGCTIGPFAYLAEDSEVEDGKTISENSAWRRMPAIGVRA
jgi:bifunctional UDP-N-acetylglucosamine pyrophosphorylase/glucosamine-1-phosphate N-acetyltransferase